MTGFQSNQIYRMMIMRWWHLLVRLVTCYRNIRRSERVRSFMVLLLVSVNGVDVCLARNVCSMHVVVLVFLP